MQSNGHVRRITVISVIITILSLLTTAFPLTGGLQDASANLVFEGGSSFSSSVYLKGGDGSQGDPYVIADVNIGPHNLQVKNSTVHVLFKNITFSRAPSFAIYLYSARNVIFDNISVKDRGEVVYAYNSRSIQIIICNFSSIRSAASSLEFVGCIDVTIRDSVFTEDPVTGAGRIHFNNGGSGHVFRRNRCDGVPYVDERFLGSGEISNSTFIGSPVSVSQGNTGGRILDNVFDDPSGNTLTLSYTYRIRVSGNFFRGQNGLFFSGMSWQWDFTPGVIENNTFESCGVGIGTMFNWNTRTTQYHIHHNYFGNCTGYAIDLNYGNYNNIWRNILYHNAGTDNSTPGDQASQNGIYQSTYPNLWTVGRLGNFWANHRTPDTNNDGITDINYTVPSAAEDHRPSTNPYFDTVPPDLQVLAPQPGAYPRSYIRTLWEAGDLQSGLDRVELSVDQGPFTDITGKDHHSMFLKEGGHDIVMRAFDRAGLCNTSSFQVSVDETEEVADLQIPIDGYYYSTDSIRITWAVQKYFTPTDLSLNIDGEWIVLPTNAKYLTRTFDEGTHTVTLHLEEDDGLAFDISSTFQIDLTSPRITLISPRAGSVLSNSFVFFNFTVSDNFGIEKVEVRYDDEPYRNRTEEFSFSEFLSEGEHLLNIRAFDLAGRISNVTFPFRIGGDAGLLILAPENGTVTRNNSVMFRWDHIGPFEWEDSFIRLGRGIFEDLGGAKSRELFLPEDGKYSITIRLVDVFDNYIENTTTITRDTVPPKLDFKTPVDGTISNNNTVIFEWMGLDPGGLSVSGYHLRFDDGEWIDVGQALSYQATVDDGSHTVVIRAWDRAGNTGERSITITIDTELPLLEFLTPIEDSFIKDSYTEFRWKATDDTGITNLTLVIDGRIRIGVLGRETYSTSIGTDGEHFVSLIGEDAAGNLADLTMRVIVDLKVPEISWDVTPPGYTNRMWTDLAFTIFDEFGIENASLMVNGNPIYLDVEASTFNLSLEEGNYELYLVARDSAGWVRELIPVELVVDLTSPTVDIDLGRSSVKGRTATVYWTSVDGNSGIDRTLIEIDGEGFYPVFSGNIHSLDGLTGGYHIITIRVWDRAGNMEEDRWAFSLDTNVDEEEKDDPIPTFAWFAIGLVCFFLLFIVVGIIISRRRSRAEGRTAITRIRKPRSLEIQPAPAAYPPVMSRAASTDLFARARPLERTDEGSGYIRPEKEGRREKRIIEAPGISEDIESGPVEGFTSSDDAGQGLFGEDTIPVEPVEEEPYPEETGEEMGSGEIPEDIPAWDEDMGEDIPEWEDIDDYEEIDDVEEWDE